MHQWQLLLRFTRAHDHALSRNIVLRDKAQASPFILFESINSRTRRFFFLSIQFCQQSATYIDLYNILVLDNQRHSLFAQSPMWIDALNAEHHFWDHLVYVEKFNRALLCASALMLVEPAGELRHITFMHIHQIIFFSRIFSTLNGYIFGWMWSISRFTSERRSTCSTCKVVAE